MSTDQRLSMAEHPDITALQAQYRWAMETRIAQAVEGLTLMAGLYVAMSPWIVGFRGVSTLEVNNLITGLAVTLLAAGFVSAYGRTHGLAWTVPILGIWVIIAPWVVAGVSTTTGIVLSNVISGAVVVLLGAAALLLALMRRTAA